MSPLDDHVDDMGPSPILDDEAIEAFFAGRPDPDWQGLEALVVLDGGVARAVAGDPPPVGPALARLMRPAPPAVVPVAAAPWRPNSVAPSQREPSAVVHRFARRPRRRMLVGVASGVLLAAGALPVAAATHVLPAPAEKVVARVVEAVTPFDIAERAGDVRPVPSTAPPSTAPQEVPAQVQLDAPGHASTAGSAASPSGTAPSSVPPGAAGANTAAPALAGPAATPATSGPATGVVGQTPAANVVSPVAGPPDTAGSGSAAPGPVGPERAGQAPATGAVPPSVPGPPVDRGIRR